jgi:Skp family chaperone for outer membrane proteins
MKHRPNPLKALILATCMAAMPIGSVQLFAQANTAKAAKHTRRKTAAKPTRVESQIQQMQQQFERQQEEIEQLKQQLQTRDQQMKQAQDAAQQAQQAAAQVQTQAQEAAQNNTQSTQAVSNLQQAVQSIQTDAEQSKQNLTAVQDEQKKVSKAVLHPSEIAYKGITISPAGSFIEAATVWRSAATGGGINTALTGVPLTHADAAHLSEFYASARQSRIALKASGKLANMDLTAYYEMDWLGTGITSNNNQSNSYVVRQRQLWARAALHNGWSFTGGQMWSLVTETTQGETAGTEVLPGTIDPQYTAGFNWTRQYGFRVVKDFGHKFWLGASVENPETLNPAGSNLPTNLLIGSAGSGGGLYNSTANYSFNLAPDLIAKVVAEPGWGHYELFGIARFFRDRIYPAGGTPYNDSTVGGGIGGGFRVPLANKKLTVGLKGLYGQGVGRYGDATIADITLHPDAQIAPLHGFDALSTIEYNPTSRLNLWFNYGGDYIFRRYYGAEGYGSPLTNMSGCNIEPLPGTGTVNGGVGFSPSTPANCGGNNKDVQELSLGYWFNFYNGSKGRLRQGIQYSHIRRDLWSGNGGILNPSNGAHGTDDMFWTSFRYYLP